MSCTNPKKAYKYGQTKNGKQKLVFKIPYGVNVDELEVQMVPCGKCIDCKLDYSKEWATRIVHEAQTSLVSCFLTLTYSPENLPDDKSVSKRELSLFIKRLRKAIYPQKIKFFACGEYGEKRSRPHYHVIVLGYDFIDKRFFGYTKAGQKIYTSKKLQRLWTIGYSSIGEVNYKTAAYIARYTLKKTKDKNGYEHVSQETGEILKVTPEFITMSQGIGKKWLEKYYTDTDKDYLNVNGMKNKVPRYYDKQREKRDPESLKVIKEKRAEEAIKRNKENTKSRLEAKAKVREAQSKMLKRSLENG